MTSGPREPIPECGLLPDLRPRTRRVACAALELFAGVGFHAATTRQIAESADVSVGSLYIHFESKEDILFRWMLTGHRDALRATREALAGGSSAEDSIRRIVHDLTLWHAQYFLLSRVATAQLRALEVNHYRIIRELRREIEACLTSPIIKGMADGSFACRDERIVANALFAIILDVARWLPARQSEADYVARSYGDLSISIARGAGITL